MDAEKTFDVLLKEEDVADVMTIGDLFDLVCRSGPKPPDWQEFKEFIKRHAWNNSTPITRETEFFDDV